MKKIILLLALIGSGAIHVLAQSARYDSIWSDPAVDKRINEGIEANRKGDFSISIPAYKGKTEITIEQNRNEFLFGTTAFMVNGFDTKDKNDKFTGLFTKFFNFAVVPFFWQTLEPEQGKLRYDSGSNYVYRRPPPDEVLSFCKKYNITPKGHCLVWNNITHSIPTWMPKDTAQVEKLFDHRIRTVAQKYGNSINTWDVVNEAMRYEFRTVLPRDYVYKSFAVAKDAFPKQDKLMINEATTEVWKHDQQEYSPYYMMIQGLLQRNIPIGGIGLQFHFFNENLFTETLAGNDMTPKQLFSILDLYQRFDKPLQISEITIPTLPNNDIGRKQQATLTKNFYRLWFSHPAVEAIVWWNSVDGTAVKGEDKWGGGFVNNDFTPKPAYDVLNNLINKEWKTNISTTVESDKYAFRGFYGDYTIRIKQGKKVTEKKVSFSKNGNKETTVSL